MHTRAIVRAGGPERDAAHSSGDGKCADVYGSRQRERDIEVESRGAERREAEGSRRWRWEDASGEVHDVRLCHVCEDVCRGCGAVQRPSNNS